MSRIFLSHSSRDTREAVALKRWLAEQNPPLANEIFLDVDAASGLRSGTRWKDALRRANARCEAVVCLLSANWEASHECKVEYRTAENLNKQIFVARLDATSGDDNMTSEWQRCDLFGDGPKTAIDVDGGPPVEFSTAGLYRLRDGIAGAGIGADSFAWPPPADPRRAPYRGWEPLESIDAAVFFGRDTQILRALDAIRGMRRSGVDSLFVVLGPSGTGKSSFLRAGILPRLRREDRRFVVMDIVRPERNALTGDSGLAASICATRAVYGLRQPSLGEVKAMCEARDVAAVSGLLAELRTTTATRLLDRDDPGTGDTPSPPTLVLPLDQAEELFSADAGAAADSFLGLLAGVIEAANATEIGLVVAATIRTDRYEVMQTHPRLAGVGSVLFDELKPMPATQFKEVILGPAARSTESGRPLRIAPDLVDQLLLDVGEGADTLPMLALTMARLYTDYGATGELALSHYRTLGGMRRVVQTEIDEVLSTDSAQHAAQLKALRAAFIPWLATINAENDQPMRRVARWADLPQDSRPLIDAMVSKRLMVKDTRDGQTVVEVALESLLRQWDELAGWLREERKDLKDADDLERSAAAWGLHRHNPAWLLEGSRLTDATALVNKPGFSQRLGRVHGYLNASHERENQRRSTEEQRRQAELKAAQERAEHAQQLANSAREQQATAEAYTTTLRKRSKVLRGVLAGTAVIAVLALVASAFAFVQRGQAQDRFLQATSVRLTAEAQAMLSGTRPGGDVRALQQVLAAHALDPHPDDGALYSAVVTRDSTDKIIPVGPLADALMEGTSPWSPDGTMLARNEEEGQQLYNVESGLPDGEPLRGLDGTTRAMAFSPDGELFAAGNDDGRIMLWSVETREQVGDALDRHDGPVNSLAFTANSKTLASGGDDGMFVWNVETGQPQDVLYERQGPVENVQFSTDGTRLMTVGYDHNDFQMWDVTTGDSIGDPVETASPDLDVEIVMSPDARFVASSAVAGAIQLWDARTLQKLGEPIQADFGLAAMAFSPDGRLLAAGGTSREVAVWDVETRALVGEPFTGHGALVVAVSFSPDGRRLASLSGDGTVRVWDMTPFLVGHSGRVDTVAYSADGTRLVSAGTDGTLRIWDVATGREIGEPIDAHELKVTGAAFAPDGGTVVSGGADGTVKIWDVESGQPVGRPVATGLPFISVFELSGDGSMVGVGFDGGGFQTWDVGDRKLVQQFGSRDTTVSGIALDPEHSLLAAASTGAVSLWDPSSGGSRGDLDFGNAAGAMGVAISSDGGRVASGNLDTTVQVFDAATGQPIGAPLSGHSDFVLSVAFSPDGTRLVSGSGDTSLRLWDLQTHSAFGDPMFGHMNVVTDVKFRPDGNQIASSSLDGTVRLWPATGSPQDLCAKLTSNMSEKQWDEWVSPEIDYVRTCPDLAVAPD